MTEKIITTIQEHGDVSVYFDRLVEGSGLLGYSKGRLYLDGETPSFDGTVSVVGHSRGDLNPNNWRHKKGIEEALTECRTLAEGLYSDRLEFGARLGFDRFKRAMSELYGHLVVARRYAIYTDLRDHCLPDMVVAFPVQGIIEELTNTGKDENGKMVTRLVVNPYQEKRGNSFAKLKIGFYPLDELKDFFPGEQ